MSLNIETAATIFGYAGVLANIYWPLMKSRSCLLAGQVLACCFMFIHFALLGAFTGSAVMGVAGFQAALAIPLGKKPNFKRVYIASLLLTPLVCFASWQGAQSIFSSLALALVCFANFQLNQVHQRILLIAAIFSWFAHNTIVGSIPGLTSNLLALVVSAYMLVVTIKKASVSPDEHHDTQH